LSGSNWEKDMFVKTKNFNSEELAQFLELQKLSFSILQSAASRLMGGETEKEVARQLVKDYYSAGFTSFFHLPVVLFGERTALPGEWTVEKFYPKRKMLDAGNSVILDASPIQDGFLVDTSYSFCFGDSQAHRDMMKHLSQYRDSIPASVNQGASFSQIADSVIENMISHGFEPVHTKHIGEVLGHRAVRLSKLPFNPRMKGFDAFAISWFKLKNKLAMKGLGRRSPLWNNLKASEHAPHDGLWLLEPHAGKDGVGAKWEEILVIEGGEARWLDEAPPHVLQWRKIEMGDFYGPAA